MSVSTEGKKHQALEILEDLIAIQSVNPFYGSGAKGEQEMSDYIEQYCKRAGLNVTRQQVFPGRDNLIIDLKVGKPESTLLFEAHMDTVSVGSMFQPLVPQYREGRLYGRGACDTKGSLAGMIYAMEECAKEPEKLSSDLILCASVDEEHAYKGLLAFLELELPISAAIVGEPTELGIVVAHKGCTRFAIQTEGKAAHSSVPEQGDNAIYQMMRVIQYIDKEVQPKLKDVHHPLCGSPTIVVGKINGGKQINIVPERCEIEVDRRIIPGEQPDQVLLDFEKDLRSHLKEEEINLSTKELLLDWALDTPINSAIVRQAQQAAEKLNLHTELIGVPYGSNASKLQQLKDIPSIVFGPGSIKQAHSIEEWVPTEEVERAANYYLYLARNFHL